MAKRSSGPPLAAYDQGASSKLNVPSLGGSSRGPALAAYDADAPRHKAPKKGKKKSAGGFFSNLLTGAEHEVTGFGPGAIKLGGAIAHDLPAILELKPFWDAEKFDKQSEFVPMVEAEGESYKQKYGPAFHGHPGETWNQIYKDPFGTVLDVAALASSGVGTATKAGLLTKAAHEIELAAPSGAITSKALAGSELSRRLRLAADATLKKLPADMQVLGENSRYARVVAYKNLRRKTGLTLQMGKYQAAMGKLKQPEVIATNLLHEFPTRKLLEDERARLVAQGGAETQLRLMSDPKILDLVDNPTAKMQSALAESQNLTSKQEGLLTSGVVKKGGKKGTVPAFTEESALLRRYQPALVARGATYDEKLGLVAPAGQTIPDMIEQIRSEINAEGRHQPIYHPQHMAEDKTGIAVGTGGRGVPVAPVHKNRAILQTLGKVAYDIEALTPSYMKTVKWAIYSDRHDDLLRAAQKVEKGTKLGTQNKPWIYVKRNRAEDIPYTERMGPEFEARLEEIYPTEAHVGAEDLLTTSESEAYVDAQGFRYMVPKAMADKIAGEYVRSSTAASNIIGKPTTVWRSLVLNLRVGWLTNNIVGNTLMYSIRNAGPAGLKWYLQSVAMRFGPAKVRQLLAESGLGPEDMIQVLPEQMAGTFLGTQFPAAGAGKLARGGRALAKYTTQPLRKVDIATEKAFRTAMTNRLIQKSPQFAKVYKEMREQTQSLSKVSKREVSIKLLQEDPKFAELVSKQVNDALGDFMQMTDFEQTYLRGLMPFYAWYREITKITLRLPLEVPGRANLLAKIGQIGYDENVAKLGPDGIEKYLRALFIIGEPKGGKAVGLNTSGLNPYMTLPQETVALKALVQAMAAGVTRVIPGTSIKIGPPGSTDAQQMLGMINPFLGSPIAGLAGTSNTGIAENIPQTRLIRGLLGKTKGPNRTYENTPLTELLAYLGVPIKNVNLNNARANYYRYH
jgi:hypothetical protein